MLRILCYNIHGGYALNGKRDLRRLNALLDSLSIDIGVFQEMETRSSRGGSDKDIEILSGASRPYHLFGANLEDRTGKYGNLIVSKYPILNGKLHKLGTSPVFEPRGAVDALIDSPTGKLRLIGTHLSLNAIERWIEVNNLIKLVHEVEQVEKHPVFVMGDLNEWSKKGKILRFLDQIMNPLPCEATFPSFLPFLRLDRVWCDVAGIQVKCRTLTGKAVKYLSDHLPILIEIETLSPNAV